ncbi:MAG: histidine kinase dimerization/phospho-acceptor domain-containing protein [Janthinobacterium lividum]
MRQFPDRDGTDLDIDDIFSHPTFAAAQAENAAFVVVAPEKRNVVWANVAAARFFDAETADALGTILFGTEGHGGGWLDGLVQGVAPGRPPRLARGGLSRGFRMRAHTALILAKASPGCGLLMAFAVPEGCGPEGESWHEAAWPAESPPDVVEWQSVADAASGSVGAEVDDAAPDTGLMLARRSQIAILRDRLAHALDGAATLRLLWRTDVADRVTQFDAEAVSKLGTRVSFLDGGSFPDVVAGFDQPGGEQLRTALASRATWSGVTLDIPVSNGAARVPMVLSASPVLGPGRAFAGFRGFATIDLGRLDLAPARPAEAAPDLEAQTAAEPASTSEFLAPAEARSDETRPSPALEETFSEASTVPVEKPNVSPPSPANVVHLRAFQSLALGRLGGLSGDATATVAPLARAPVDMPSADPSADEAATLQPSTSLGVDLAFLALGEALRARIGGPRSVGETAEAQTSPEPIATEPASTGLQEEVSFDDRSPSPVSAADRAPVDAEPAMPDTAAPDGPALLREIPMPLIVTVGSSPVFVNQRATTLLGYAAAADLAQARQDIRASVETGAVSARDAQGRDVTLQARQAGVSWNGEAATLWILEQTAAAEPDAENTLPASNPGDADADIAARDLLDRVDDAVALLDANGLVRRLNRRGETWFENALGRSFTQLLAADSRSPALALLGDVRGQKEGLGTPPLRLDVQARVGRGTPVPMALALGRLGAAGFYLTLRDHSALRRAESERAGAERDQVRDADRLPTLLGKVSHEIRTPLNAILGFAEVMMDERFGPLGNPRYKDYLKDIHTSGSQVMTLVEDLLDLSRIEAGQLDLAVEALDVNRIVAETVTQMQPEAHRERVIMRTSLGGRIPAVLADERSARQIVRNLLSNAVKFNEPGGQVIISTALSDSGAVLLRVRDTGVGMTDGEIAAALEPFGGGLPSHAANGNGLGLPLTRALVGVNGASMAISSRPREGTLVEVAFASAGTVHERRPA